jgi:hypothetical protein
MGRFKNLKVNDITARSLSNSDGIKTPGTMTTL